MSSKRQEGSRDLECPALKGRGGTRVSDKEHIGSVANTGNSVNPMRQSLTGKTARE